MPRLKYMRETIVNNFLIGAAALAFGGAALAQGMQPPAVQTPRMDMPSQMGPMTERVQTRSEMVARIQKHFAKMDTNRDGFIAGDEMQAMGGEHGQMGAIHDGNDMAARGGPMGNPGAMFDRLDSNHDGMISRDEFARGHAMRNEHREVAMNGAPGMDGGEHQGMMKMHGKGGGGMGGHMLKMADANKDGRVSLQEMTAAALQHFDRMDTNHDGRITPEERQAMRPHARTAG